MLLLSPAAGNKTMLLWVKTTVFGSMWPWHVHVMMRDLCQYIKTKLICTYSDEEGNSCRAGLIAAWGSAFVCVSVCTCAFAWLSSCQNKHFSEYLMHTFICVCLSACDNRMSAKTQELMRPFFVPGMDWARCTQLWALFLCMITNCHE